jgi:hypothetical protein
MVRKSLIAGGFACTFALAACTMLPALEEATGGIPVSDIVLRTKCELSDAFVDDEGRWLPDSDAKFAWLQNWTAQADLTLQILDQATLAPGVSAIEPLHNAYPNVGPSSISTSGAPGTAISAVSQSFAVAAGANLNGQAQRTETMSFTFSVAELRDWRTNANTARLLRHFGQHGSARTSRAEGVVSTGGVAGGGHARAIVCGISSQTGQRCLGAESHEAGRIKNRET